MKNETDAYPLAKKELSKFNATKLKEIVKKANTDTRDGAFILFCAALDVLESKISSQEFESFEESL